MATPYYQVPADVIADGIELRPVATGRWLNKYSGTCLVLSIVMIVSASTSGFQNVNAVEPTDLLSLSNPSHSLSKYGIGSSPLERLAILAIQANHLDNQLRDNSRKATVRATITRAENDAVRDMDDETKAEVARVMKAAVVRAETIKREDLAGVTAPMGFFDPIGFSTKVSEGRLLFFREAELKHGRICMLASLGFVVGEKFHPLFGGINDAPSTFAAFQDVQYLQNFWKTILFCIGILEIPRINGFNWAQPTSDWTLNADQTPGDYGFDPLKLKPDKADEFKALQTKELNNGRLAMFAAAGMIAQEYVTGKKLF